MNISTFCALFHRGKISQREFIILRKRCLRKNDEEDDWVNDSFDFEAITEHESRRLFRFKKADVVYLQTCLRIPERVKTSERDDVSGLEALCILLRRLSYPNRWIELRRLFGRSHGSLCRVFYKILDHINANFGSLLRDWDQSWLQEPDFQTFSAAITEKGGVIPRVFGFIDGTARGTCRPGLHQRSFFSGHKRKHCLKYQSIVVPNGMYKRVTHFQTNETFPDDLFLGMIANLTLGHRGTMNDARLFRVSKISAKLKAHMQGWENAYIMYGDGGYPQDPVLRKPFSRAQILANPRRGDTNQRMSTVRESVEWGFKEIVSSFAYVDFSKQMKIFEKPVNKIYRTAVCTGTKRLDISILVHRVLRNI